MDEAAERERKAKELRKTIEEQDAASAPTEGPPPADQISEPRPGESINDFVERRRRELKRRE